MNDTTTQGTAYFDLKDYIRSIICPDVAAQMAQSAAFAIDVQIQSAVRQLFNKLREYHEDVGVESLTGMNVALRERAFAEEVFALVGPGDLGPVTTVKQLNHIREEWQQLAGELTSMTFDWKGVPRTYEIRPIEEMLTREVKFNVKPQTEARIRTLVARRAGDDVGKDDVEKVIERRMQREKQRSVDTATRLMEQQQALVNIYTLVSEMDTDTLETRVDSETAHTTIEVEDAAGQWSKKNVRTQRITAIGESLEFHDLDIELQRNMIDGALRGAARAEDFATSSSAITDAEFDEVSFAVLKVERELKAVLKSPKYELPKRVREAAASI